MNDPVIVGHAERIKALEISQEVNMAMIETRFRKLEEAAEQERIRKEQADFRMMGELRARAEAAEAALKAKG